MIVDSSWTFQETVKNIKAVKLQYEEILSSFSIFEIKEKNIFKRELRDSIYSLNMEEYKKDRLWEYMNDCLDFIVLKQICERNNNGKRTKKQIKISN